MEDGSSHMSSTLTLNDESFDHLRIRINTTQALLDEEQRAKDEPFAGLNAEAEEQYSLLVEI